MRHSLRFALVSFFLTVLFARLTFAQKQSACLDLPASTCSASGINRNCDLYIDRLRPVAPPTVYLRRSDKVTVHVRNFNPFESLALDFKTASDTTPSDPFATGFSSLNGTITKLTAITLTAAKPIGDEFFAFVAFDGGVPQPNPFTAERGKLKQAAADQRVLFSEYDPSIVMNEIFLATQPPLPTACTAQIAFDDKGYPNPWTSPGKWADPVIAVLNALQTDNTTQVALALRVNQLDSDVAALVAYNPPPSTPANLRVIWQKAVARIQARQSLLDQWKGNPPTAPTAPTPAQDAALIKAINNLNLKNLAPSEITFTVPDISPKDHNVTAETWSLDYLNTFQAAVKNAVVPPSAPPPAVNILTSTTQPPAPTAIVPVNVTFQRAQRLEFATGVMTPIRGYHSYSAAEAASNGTVTGTVIQESKTYTVLPMAMTNIVLKQGVPKGAPLGGFFTIGVGYNTVNSSIEFGLGPSFSFRSMVVSALADIGQDTHLSDGFTAGQSLPSNNTKPLTTNYWFVRPAFGLSVRIPLGGGQSASPSNSGSGSGSGKPKPSGQ